MATNRPIPRHLCALLLVAFVYQMNVCSCGHTEHNHWLQLGTSWAAASSEAHLTGAAGESHDCDGEGLVYTTGQRVSVDSPQDAPALAPAIGLGSPHAALGLSGRAALVARDLPGPYAPQPRALMQVFLL